MEGKDILNKLKRMSEVNNIKDVKSLTNALYPGTHCPLFGAAIAMKGIKDAVMLVIGTDECTYYTKKFTGNSNEFGGVDGRCLSLILDQHDVTFGCKEKLENALEEIVNEYDTSAIFLITTCVIEVTGDDIDSLSIAASKKYNIPVITVHTEHFRCESHMPGLENVLTACGNVMKEVERNDSVNILGHRFGNINKTEMFRFLQKTGVKVNLQLPSSCTIEEISNAPRAKVNIVCNSIALPLAKYMEERFNIPYVNFNKFCNPQRIYEAYKELFHHLQLEMPLEIERLKKESEEKMKEAREYFDGVSYIYGNTTLIPFEVCEFLTDIGMEAKLIQVKEINDSDRSYMKNILASGVNPYICKSANIAPLQYIYGELKPDIYIGHESEMNLRRHGIILVRSSDEGDKLGFELPNNIIKVLKEFTDIARDYKSAKQEEKKYGVM